MLLAVSLLYACVTDSYGLAARHCGSFVTPKTCTTVLFPSVGKMILFYGPLQTSRALPSLLILVPLPYH